MKISLRFSMFVPASGLCFLLFTVSCGPSKEEIEKRLKEEKEHQEMVKTTMDKHKAGMDTFVLRLRMMKEKLTRPDTFFVSGSLNPALTLDYDKPNAITISFESIDDPMLEEKNDLFGMSETDAGRTLNNYLNLKAGKEPDIYLFYSDDKATVEKKVAACDINQTPYALIIMRDTVTPIVIGEHSYTGGETLGYCWLADLRNMEVVGRRMIYASPGEVMVSNKESDWEKKRKIESSCNREAERAINKWLKEFKRGNS